MTRTLGSIALLVTLIGSNAVQARDDAVCAGLEKQIASENAAAERWQLDEFVHRVCNAVDIERAVSVYLLGKDNPPAIPPVTCYADEAVLTAARSDTSKWVNFTTPSPRLIEHVAEQATPSCEQWLKETVLAERFAATRSPEELAEFEAERQLAAAEKQREDAASKAAAEVERRIAAAWAASGVAPADRILWRDTEQPRAHRDTETTTFFNEMNVALESSRAQKSLFTPPAKGEFETTQAYEARVAQARVKFDAATSTAAGDVTRSWPARRETLVGRFLGDPLVESATYNADRGAFTVAIGSASSPYKVTAEIAVPLGEAPAAKAAILKADSNVLIAVLGGKMTPLAGVLRSSTQLWGGKVVSYTQSPIVLGPDAAASWQEEQKRRVDARAAERERERANRNRQYGHAGPFLEASSIVCADFRSIFRAMALARAGNPYVPIPDDCIESPADRLTPLTSAQVVDGNVMKIVFKANGSAGFTAIESIER